jgi:hypothetical protein
MANWAMKLARNVAERYLHERRWRRWQAYRALFQDGDGKLTAEADIVLGDLRDFCRGHQSTFDPDPRVHALMEGRREVWLRIAEALAIDEPMMMRLDANRPTISEGDDNE